MSYNAGPYFNSQRWYDTMMDQRTREAILRKAAEVEHEHEKDSDDELLDLIRERTDELGYVPFAADFLAARLIVRRFGSWNKALRMAQLSHPRGPFRLRDTQLYQKEYKIQQKLHRIEKEKKLKKRRATAVERKKRKEDQER